MSKAILFLCQHWYEKAVGVIFPALCGMAALYYLTKKGSTAPTFEQIAGSLLVFVIAHIVWVFTTRIPKCPAGKVGIVLAIICESDEQAMILQADFLSHIAQHVTERDASTIFSVIHLKPALARRARDQEKARKVLDKAKGHFMIFGEVKKRTVYGAPTFCLALHGMVRHTPIPDEVSAALGRDFRQVLPQKWLVPEDNSVFAFELFSDSIAIGTRYIIGNAALLSGDLVLAERLLRQVEVDLGTKRANIGLVNVINGQLPSKLIGLYERWLDHLYQRYFGTRDTADLTETEDIALRLLERNPSNQKGLLLKAICAFELRRDTLEAKRLVRLCRNRQDSTWRYNLAFLYAYDGDLETAHDHYRKAFRSPSNNPRVAIECEDFIAHVLEQEPAMEQLHFCLGLLNYNLKEDYKAAADDFKRFIESECASNYLWAVGVAQKLRERCLSGSH